MSWLKRWRNARDAFLSTFFRLDEIREELRRTNARYLDAAAWSRMTGISEDRAEKQLQSGATEGFFERWYLYEGADAPAPFVVPEEDLNGVVRLSTLGFITEEDREIKVSPYRSRPVYIAARD